MTDELDRIRELRGEPPRPDPAWVDRTRDDLLARAQAEAADEAATGPAASRPDGAETATGATVVPLRRRLREAAGGDRWRVAAAAAVLVVAIGVALLSVLPDGQEAPSSPVATTGPDGEAAPTFAATCTGPDGVYEVGYPDAWHANRGEVDDPCQYFDPEPIELEPGTGGGPRSAVTIRVLPVPFDRASQPDPASRQISVERVTVADLDAIREVRESTGRGALPAGLRSYRYLVDLGDRALLAVTYDTPEADFTHRRQILDQMMSTLRLDRR